jgi:hypothetical protein
MEQCSSSARHPTSHLSPRSAGEGTVLTKGLSCAHSFRLVLTRRLAAASLSYRRPTASPLGRSSSAARSPASWDGPRASGRPTGAPP